MVARISWLGYVQYVVIGILFYLFVMSSAFWLISAGLGLVLGENKAVANTVFFILTLLYLAGFGYVLYQTRQCKAFVDKDGVWFYSGLFPWTRGIRGVRWENFDQAQFRPGMFSWMFCTYTVYLKDRYGGTVVIKNLYNGRDWSSSVNDVALGSSKKIGG